MLKRLIHIYSILLIACLFFTCTKEVVVPVTAEFEIEIVNNDYSAPVQVVIFNKSKEADTYQWTFEGGTPSSSTSRNPGSIIYETEGEYSIKLYASNKDDSEDEKTVSFKIDAPVIIDFNVESIESNFPPVELVITNTTSGATNYRWGFEGGLPATSTEQHPPNIVFDEPGEYKIWLEVSNGFETYDLEKTIIVEENLDADFDWEVSFDDDDFQIPVELNMQSTHISTTTFQWIFENGTPSTSTEENPKVVFNEVGIHEITLIASNGKDSKTISKNVETYPNPNLKTFENIKLGINTSHNNNEIGSFFSTYNREPYKKNEVNSENGPLIDIVFFGFNNSFSQNKFVSPNDLSSTTFESIPGATHTKFINSLESCSCSASLSVADFDNMINDSELKDLVIEETVEGLQPFDNSVVPRIILFENNRGIKGALKIKEYVQDGQDSYIIVDIKVQKE